VQHFGDYTRARVSPSALLPTSVVLEQRLWLGLLTRKPSRLVNTYRLSLKEFITYCKVRAVCALSTQLSCRLSCAAAEVLTWFEAGCVVWSPNSCNNLLQHWMHLPCHPLL
jgi:hypothetical protein